MRVNTKRLAEWLQRRLQHASDDQRLSWVVRHSLLGADVMDESMITVRHVKLLTRAVLRKPKAKRKQRKSR